jgi:hypothetical protein
MKNRKGGQLVEPEIDRLWRAFRHARS